MTDTPIWFTNMVSAVTPTTVWGATHKHVSLQLGNDPTSRLILAFGDFSYLEHLPWSSLSGSRDPRISNAYDDLAIEIIKKRNNKAGGIDIFTQHIFCDYMRLSTQLTQFVSDYITTWNKRAVTRQFVLSDIAAQARALNFNPDDINRCIVCGIKNAFDQINEANLRRENPQDAAKTAENHLEVVMLCHRHEPPHGGLGYNDDNFQALLPLARGVLGIKGPSSSKVSLHVLRTKFDQNRIA